VVDIVCDMFGQLFGIEGTSGGVYRRLEVIDVRGELGPLCHDV
jgi:hypothetical protein